MRGAARVIAFMAYTLSVFNHNAVAAGAVFFLLLLLSPTCLWGIRD